jgi:DNA-binding LytR/AlgR family response regulator
LLKLKEQNEKLALSGEILKKKIDDYNNDNANKSIYLSPENTPEKFSFLCPDILYIKSADNYAEIHFMDGEQLKKQLIRNTLKNIEQQLRKFPNFIRCHRICIVNVHKIEKLVGNCNNHSLIIKGTLEQIPVSRSYFLKIKEAL